MNSTRFAETRSRQEWGAHRGPFLASRLPLSGTRAQVDWDHWSMVQQLRQPTGTACRRAEGCRDLEKNCWRLSRRSTTNIPEHRFSAGQSEGNSTTVSSIQPAPYWYSDPAKLRPRISASTKASTNSLPATNLGISDAAGPQRCSSTIVLVVAPGTLVEKRTSASTRLRSPRADRRFRLTIRCSRPV